MYTVSAVIFESVALITISVRLAAVVIYTVIPVPLLSIANPSLVIDSTIKLPVSLVVPGFLTLLILNSIISPLYTGKVVKVSVAWIVPFNS